MAYNLKYSGAELNNLLDRLNNIFNLIYPVGSIYISTASTNPSTLFGGTWARIGEGRTLIDCGTTYAAGATGGEANHPLTTNETPAHTHTRGTMEIEGGCERFGHTSNVTWGLNLQDSYWYGALSSYNAGGECYAKDPYGTLYNSSQKQSGLKFKASNNWTGATSSVGGSAAHNNMPPYLATYIWKRTA